MRNDPILARKEFRGVTVPMVIYVEGGLHYLRGNSAPYFSLTCTEHRKGFPDQCWLGGADHDEIRRHFGRKFDDLAALHLSDIDGVPMHAAANAWYWLAGALGGAGADYHGGNGSPLRQPDECFRIFAGYLRLPLEEAARIRNDFAAAGLTVQTGGREKLQEIVEAQKPRWKAEAEACIAAHQLRVYGDPWTPKA